VAWRGGRRSREELELSPGRRKKSRGEETGHPPTAPPVLL
jgi:hypothetical protein